MGSKVIGGIQTAATGAILVASLMTNPAGWAIAAGAIVGFGVGYLTTKNTSLSLDTSPSSQTVRGSKEPARYAFGRFSTGGILFFCQEQSGEQDTNEWLHLAFYISEGAITSIDEIYLDEVNINTYIVSNIPTFDVNEASISEGTQRVYKGRVYTALQNMTAPLPIPYTIAGYDYWERGGKVDDLNKASYEVHINRTTCDPFMLENCSDWHDSMIGRNISWVRVSIKYCDEISSLPTFRFVGKGLAVYDPRTDTTEYSENPSLIGRHYLKEILKTPDDEIIDEYFIESANISDETVVNADGSASKRYVMGGIIGDNERRADIMGKIEDSCAGHFIRLGGRWGFIAGAYYGPYDLTITADDFLGEISFQTEVNNSDAINTVTGTFVDPDSSWEETDYPQAQNTEWADEDGTELTEDLNLSYVNNVYQAQRLAWINLKQRRAASVVNMNLNFMGYACRPGRIVRIYLPKLNIDGEFIVTNWSMGLENACQVAFQSYDADIFDDAVGEAYDPLGFVSLPTGGLVAPSDLAWTALLESVVAQGYLSWTPPTDTVDYYSITIRNTDEEVVQTYQVVGDTSICNVSGLTAGTYIMSVAAVSGIKKSGETTILSDINVPATPQIVTYTNTIDSITIIPSNPTTSINGGTYEYWFSISTVTNPLTEATKLGQGLSFTKQNLAFNTTYHFYIRSVNAYGYSGFYHLEASTSNDVSALLSALTNQITSSQLAEDLQSAIEDLPNIVNDITDLQGDVTGLEDNVNTLQGIIDELLGAPEYDVNETSIDAGEIRTYEGHLYRADVNMTSPIPVPTDTGYWTDLGEFTSIQEQLDEVSSQIVTLTGIVDGTARKTYALNSQYRRDDGSTELETLIANLRSDARFVEEVQVRADADEALAQRLTTAEASVDSLGSSLTELEQVVADNQSSTATALTALESQIDTAEGNIAANAGAINNLQTHVSNIDDELESTATALTALESTVIDPDTGLSSKASAQDLTEVSTTLDSVQAQRTLKVATQDSEGRYVLAGIALSADGTVSQSKIYMLADEIVLLNEEDGTATTPFIVSGGNVYINSAFINQLTASTITATSLIRSSDGKMVLDFTNKTITITV
ncbi:MAG: DUF1983 domain-containing protein [Deferribacterales bacterium]